MHYVFGVLYSWAIEMASWLRDRQNGWNSHPDRPTGVLGAGGAHSKDPGPSYSARVSHGLGPLPFGYERTGCRGPAKTDSGSGERLRSFGCSLEGGGLARGDVDGRASSSGVCPGSARRGGGFQRVDVAGKKPTVLPGCSRCLGLFRLREGLGYRRADDVTPLFCFFVQVRGLRPAGARAGLRRSR